MTEKKLPQWVTNVKNNRVLGSKKEQFVQVSGSFLWYGQNLSKDAFLVYIHLRMFHWKGNPNPVFPSIKTLESLTKLSRAILLDAIQELEYFGWLKVSRGWKTIEVKGKNIETENNLYEFTIPTQRVGQSDHLERRYSPLTKEERMKFKRAQSKKRRGDKDIDVEGFIARLNSQADVPDDGQTYYLRNPKSDFSYDEDDSDSKEDYDYGIPF